jgi:hypothetical protein
MACFGREIERGNRFLESPFVIGFEIVEYSCHVPAYITQVIIKIMSFCSVLPITANKADYMKTKYKMFIKFWF